MARVKTFTNGGSLLPGDLNAIEDDFEFAFSTYKTITQRGGRIASAAAAGTYLLRYHGVGANAALGDAGVVPAADLAPMFYLDPADWLANTRVSKLRVRGAVITNAVAPAANFTFGLYPVATWGGGASTYPFINTIGAVVAGSPPAAIAAPALSTQTVVTGADFTFPGAGWYVLAVVTSAGTAATSVEACYADLQLRQV